MSQAAGPMIALQKVLKSFPSLHHDGHRVRAVDNLDLVVQRGETFGLLGADGAGKTTTLRLLNGLLRPDAGTMRVAGLDPTRRAECRQIHTRVGYMPQQFALYGDLSVWENLDFAAESYGLTGAQKAERLPRLLHFARLEEFKERLGAQLSGGMKKKLALACMLVHEPEALFLDEPTLGVDPVSRREFWNLLSDLRAEKGVTIFVCTPYMDEAERCHRVGLLYEGRLIACDTPRGIRHLVPGELLELRCSDVYAAQNAVSHLEGVLEVQTYGDLLHVFVDHAPARMGGVQAALLAQGIQVSAVRTVDARMEEAFVSLIRRQGLLPDRDEVNP
jgi:ABC-2 type transport system ATP-binding protein